MKLLKLLIGAEFAEKPAEGTDPTPFTLHPDSSGIGRCNRQNSIQFSRCQIFCKDVHGLSRPVDEPERFTLELLFTETTIFMNGYLRYRDGIDRKSTRLNSSHVALSYALFCLTKR